MNQKNIKALATFLVLSMNYSLAFGAKISLPEVIQIAFDKNKNTQANAYQLQASLKDIEALSKSSYLPRFSIGASLNQSQSKDLLANSYQIRYRASSAFATISMNLYNGGLDKLRIAQAKCGHEMMSAEYNSTDTQIQDTKGQIATVVAFSYLSIVQNLAEHDFYELKNKMFEALLPFASTTAETNRINNSLADLKISISENYDEFQILSNSYREVVNEDLPKALEGLDETIQSIHIPETAVKAFEIAKVKSPDIQTSQISVRCAEIGSQISARELYAPRVDMHSSIHRSNAVVQPGGQESKVNDRTLGLSVAVPFDFGQRLRAEGSQLRLESAKKGLEARLSKVESSLSNDFLRLQSLEKSAVAYQDTYNAVIQQIGSAISSVQAKTMSVEEALDLIDSLGGRFRNANNTKRNLIEKRFAIQRQIGTLFDSMLEVSKIKKSLVNKDITN